MKTLITCIAALFVIVACSNDDDNTVNTNILGTWGLSEILADPGDGSGTFMPVDSPRQVTFNANGTYSSNSESFCSFSGDNVGIQPSTGTYTETAIHCGDANPANDLQYTIDANGSLIISYPYIEPCQAKYERIE
jgi:hypothetical protein